MADLAAARVVVDRVREDRGGAAPVVLLDGAEAGAGLVEPAREEHDVVLGVVERVAGLELAPRDAAGAAVVPGAAGEGVGGVAGRRQAPGHGDEARAVGAVAALRALRGLGVHHPVRDPVERAVDDRQAPRGGALADRAGGAGRGDLFGGPPVGLVEVDVVDVAHAGGDRDDAHRAGDHQAGEPAGRHGGLRRHAATLTQPACQEKIPTERSEIPAGGGQPRLPAVTALTSGRSRWTVGEWTPGGRGRENAGDGHDASGAG